MYTQYLNRLPNTIPAQALPQEKSQSIVADRCTQEATAALGNLEISRETKIASKVGAFSAEDQQFIENAKMLYKLIPDLKSPIQLKLDIGPADCDKSPDNMVKLFELVESTEQFNEDDLLKFFKCMFGDKLENRVITHLKNSLACIQQNDELNTYLEPFLLAVEKLVQEDEEMEPLLLKLKQNKNQLAQAKEKRNELLAQSFLGKLIPSLTNYYQVSNRKFETIIILADCIHHAHNVNFANQEEQAQTEAAKKLYDSLLDMIVAVKNGHVLNKNNLKEKARSLLINSENYSLYAIAAQNKECESFYKLKSDLENISTQFRAQIDQALA